MDDGDLFSLIIQMRDVGGWEVNPIGCVTPSLRIYLDPSGPHRSSAEPCVDLFMLPHELRPSGRLVEELHNYCRGLAPKKIRNESVVSGEPVLEQRMSLTIGRTYHYVDLENERDAAAEEKFSWALTLSREAMNAAGCGGLGDLGCLINDYTTKNYISDHSDSDIDLVPNSPIGCYTDYCYDSEDTPRVEPGTNCRVIVFSRKLGNSKKDAGILVVATVPGLVYIMHNAQHGYKHGSPVPGNKLSAPCDPGVNRVSITVRVFVPKDEQTLGSSEFKKARFDDGPDKHADV